MPGAAPVSTPEGDRDEAERERVYRSLVRRRQSALRALAARFAPTAADREDLYQDMLLAIWKALPRFRGEASLETYAQRVAHSTAIDHARRRRIVLPEVDLVDPAPGPEEHLGRARAGARLRAAIERLPRMLRDVFLLHLEGHDYRTIARHTGLTESNVGARLTRARARLRRRLGRVVPA
jgi:RNA polymerase sigma-70 factor (ECF subfamily)